MIHYLTGHRRIVGDDDCGVLFTEEEYARYKARVLPQRLKNRFYASWGPKEDTSLDCKVMAGTGLSLTSTQQIIGPETMCFCGHRYQCKVLFP